MEEADKLVLDTVHGMVLGANAIVHAADQASHMLAGRVYAGTWPATVGPGASSRPLE
jgi:hypothetical protein